MKSDLEIIVSVLRKHGYMDLASDIEDAECERDDEQAAADRVALNTISDTYGSGE